MILVQVLSGAIDGKKIICCNIYLSIYLFYIGSVNIFSDTYNFQYYVFYLIKNYLK